MLFLSLVLCGTLALALDRGAIESTIKSDDNDSSSMRMSDTNFRDKTGESVLDGAAVSSLAEDGLPEGWPNPQEGGQSSDNSPSSAGSKTDGAPGTATPLRMLWNGGSERCFGAPSGGKWNVYGARSAQQCEGKCAADPSCKYVVHGSGDRGCSKFDTCEPKSDPSQLWTVWTKEPDTVVQPEPPAVQSTPPDSQIHKDEALSLRVLWSGSETRCSGAPSGGKWNEYGTELSSQQCEEKCTADPSCKYVVHSVGEGGCSKFDTCVAKTDPNRVWNVYTKDPGEPDVYTTLPPASPVFPLKPADTLPLANGAAADTSKRSMFFGVLSIPGNAARRQTQRDTWGKMAAEAGGVVRFYSCDRDSEGTSVTESFVDEQEQHHDLVMIPCNEGYLDGQLTRKVRLLMENFLSQPGSEKYDTFMKVDDDSFINVPKVIKLLPKKSSKKHFYFGKMAPEGEKPIRGKLEAWYEPHELWEGRYPRTMLGLGYGMDRALLQKILKDDADMVNKKMLYNEDRATAVWVYLEKEDFGVKNINYIDIPALTGYGESVWDMPTHDRADSIPLWHKVSRDEMTCIHEVVTKPQGRRKQPGKMGNIATCFLEKGMDNPVTNLQGTRDAVVEHHYAKALKRSDFEKRKPVELK